MHVKDEGGQALGHLEVGVTPQLGLKGGVALTKVGQGRLDQGVAIDALDQPSRRHRQEPSRRQPQGDFLFAPPQNRVEIDQIVA